MPEEEKNFVDKDHETMDENGGSTDKNPKGKTKKKAPEKNKSEETKPLPGVNFTSFIFSLSSTALFHLGDIPDPQTGKTTLDLTMAKNSIDTISMLQEKTAGNLTDDEQKFTESILADLRWRFVKAKKN